MTPYVESDPTSAAYRDGLRQAKANGGPNANPYPSGTPDHDQFERGDIDGHRDWKWRNMDGEDE